MPGLTEVVLPMLCMFSGLVKIKEANDIEEKLNEVERLLKNAINMPFKVSLSLCPAVKRYVSNWLINYFLFSAPNSIPGRK